MNVATHVELTVQLCEDPMACDRAERGERRAARAAARSYNHSVLNLQSLNTHDIQTKRCGLGAGNASRHAGSQTKTLASRIIRYAWYTPSPHLSSTRAERLGHTHPTLRLQAWWLRRECRSKQLCSAGTACRALRMLAEFNARSFDRGRPAICGAAGIEASVHHLT